MTGYTNVVQRLPREARQLVDIQVEGDSVTVQTTRDEAARLGFALRAGCETTSRAEYYIRTGLSQPVLREITAALIAAESLLSIELASGVEEIENPHRPRPQE